MKPKWFFRQRPLWVMLILVFYLPLQSRSISKLLNQYGLLSLNEWLMYYSYDFTGPTVYPYSYVYGSGFFPVKDGLLIYNEALVWSGFVHDGRQPALRSGGSMYSSGVIPGWIVKTGRTGQWPRPVSNEDKRVRMYHWRKDFFTVSDEQLKKEIALYLNISEKSVTQAQIDTLRQQYWKDLEEWPADLGAPYYDRNQNGRYDPDYDEPGFLDADQLVWYVVNDLSESNTEALFGSLPFGLEIQITAWSYKIGLSSVVFSRYRIINKSGFPIDSMFVGLFTDCDIGDYRDDLVGCDSTLGYGFAYNGAPVDTVFDRLNMAPPALGVVLLQGPLVPAPGATAYRNFEEITDYKNLPMTSFWYDASGDMYSVPPFGFYRGALQLFGNLQGYADFDGNKLIPFDFYNGHEFVPTSPWPLSGNPLTGQGHVDGKGFNVGPGARKFMVNSGPFNMKPGDTQELIFATVAAYSSSDYLDALAKLRRMMPTVKKAYQEFLTFEPPVGPRITRQPEKPDTTGVDYFLLAEGAPNPFKQNVKIKFRLLNDMDVRLDVFNSAGQRVKTIYRGALAKGVHALQWDGTNQSGKRLPSGVYFVRLKHGPLMRWKKIIMLK